MKPDSMDRIFHALASQHRRKIMDLVMNMPGCSVNDICKYFSTSRISVMKHLGVLVEAELIISKKEGRTRQLFFNSAPMQLIYDRWATEYSRFWSSQAIDLKYQVESLMSVSEVEGSPSDASNPKEENMQAGPRKTQATKKATRKKVKKKRKNNDVK